jgi:hypothetical protein
MAHDPHRERPGRTIPQPAFDGDDGAADPRVAAALASYAKDPGRHLDVFLVLQRGRVLVPVVAVIGEVGQANAGPAREPTGDLPVSSGVEMATALLTGRDGRQALLAFTSLETLAAWRTEARPVPVPAALAARSALQEGAEALLVDVAGPTPYAVEGDLLEGLARGWTLVPARTGPVWVQPEE